MRVSVPATSANLGPGFDCLGLAISIKNQVIIRPSKFHSVSLKGEVRIILLLKITICLYPYLMIFIIIYHIKKTF